MSLLLALTASGGGATTYTDAFLDTVSATDGVGTSAGFSNAVYDSLSLIDTQVGKVTFSAALTDTVSATESVTATQVFTSALGDGVSLADTYAAKGSFNAALLEQLTLADSYMLGGFTYTDTMTAQVALSDGATVRTIIAASLGEAVAVADSLGAKQIAVSSIGSSLVLSASFDGIRIGLTWPSPADVRLGVQYGPTGADYTGTLTGGTGETVFASRMSVTLTTDKLYVAQKPRREASSAVEPRTTQQSSKGKNVFVCTATPTHHVLTTPDEIWVTTNKETL